MKIFRYLLIFIASLIAILFLVIIVIFFPLPFIKGKFKDEFIVKNPSRDTTFRYERYGKWIKMINEDSGSGAGMPFVITATGEIDNETEVYLQYVGHPRKVYFCTLPKGKIDNFFHGELYENKAEIVFLHQQATSGNLKIVFELGRGPGYGNYPNSEK